MNNASGLAARTFDNSAENPWKPDPSVQVIWGSDSRDEMMEGWFDYRVALPEPVIPPSVRVSQQE